MPTGYTAAIKGGISFKQFAMDCARAFGACVMLRDEPGGGESIPEKLMPSTYSKDALEAAKLRLARLEAMTPIACLMARNREHGENEARRLARIEEDASLLKKYKAMRANVESWTPPTVDHSGIKEFMIKQIDESIRFDCGFYDDPGAEKSPDEWHKGAIRKQLNDIAYHTKSYAEEVERTNQRNAWIKALRDSL